MIKPKKYFKSNSKPKVSKNYSGKCELSQLPDRSYFKVVKKDGSLSKTTYYKDKGSWNRQSRKYDVNSTNDVYGTGRSMKGTTKVSTEFIY